MRGFSWPTVIVATVVPATLIGTGLSVPAIDWGRLPKSRPGALLLPAAFGFLGLLLIIRQVWLLRDVHRELHQAEPYEGGFIPVTLALSRLLRAKFGPIAGGMFVLALGSGLSIAFSVASVGSATWQAIPWAITSPALVAALAALVGAFIVGFACGAALHRFDQGAVFVGGRRHMQKELAQLVQNEGQGEPGA